jgi:cyclopropane fatty-acyl-phospholipid synthase-like methyltransferase
VTHDARTVDAPHATHEQHLEEFTDSDDPSTARTWFPYLLGGAPAVERGCRGVDRIPAVRPVTCGTGPVPTRDSWIAR